MPDSQPARRGPKKGSTWKWTGRVVRCSCGAIIHEEALSPTGNHMRSVIHRRHAEIRKLAEENNITHMEIAKRMGITRERVRQILTKMMNKTGRQLQAERTVKKMEQLARIKEAEVLNSPLVYALRQSMPWATFGAASYSWLTRGVTVEINGHRCVIKPGYPTKMKGNWYWRIVTSRRQHDFLIYKLDQDWMILPRSRTKEMVGNATYMTLYSQYPQMGAKSAKHDWKDWIDRFDLLK
jgi:predicted DNA-binding protein (UPF0251 family)